MKTLHNVEKQQQNLCLSLLPHISWIHLVLLWNVLVVIIVVAIVILLTCDSFGLNF